MGYFANGTEGLIYEDQYCVRCVHNEDGCAVMDAHMLYNHDEANNDSSILDILIPREGLGNGECKMFLEKGEEL